MIDIDDDDERIESHQQKQRIENWICDLEEIEDQLSEKDLEFVEEVRSLLDAEENLNVIDPGDVGDLWDKYLGE